jgi:hypothetical protein
MAEKLSTLQQLKKLDEERAKLLESAKNDALTRAEEAINELVALGFDYEIVEPARGQHVKRELHAKRRHPITTRKGHAQYASTRPIPRMIRGLIGLKQGRSRLRMQNFQRGG